MATYLGFDPHKGSLYYFVSYNDDDARRIAPIAQGLCRENIPLWYDFGIPWYGICRYQKRTCGIYSVVCIVVLSSSYGTVWSLN